MSYVVCVADDSVRKWNHGLPVTSRCVVIDWGGDVYLLGNATDGPGSIALAGECLRLGSNTGETGMRKISELTARVGW